MNFNLNNQGGIIYVLTNRSSICGTYEYMSPEIVYRQSHGFAVDIWCLGILLYEMLHGSPPFKAENLDQIKGEFRRTKLKINPSVDPDVEDLIKKLLNFEAKSRIKIDEVLRHRAFTKNKRNFTRPLTQEEYKLLVKYYYLNSGGTNLPTHNIDYAKQLKRDSELSKHSVRTKKSLTQQRSDRKIQNQGRYPNNDFKVVNNAVGFSKNNFQPKKFESPAIKGKIGKYNNFEPKKFITPNKIPNQDQAGKDRNDDIRFYNPPKFVKDQSDKKKPISGFLKKKKPEINQEHSSTSKYKNSGLKKKLKNQEKKIQVSTSKSKKSNNSNSKKTLSQLRKFSGNGINTIKSKIQLLNKPTQSRSLSLQKMLNSSFISHQSSYVNPRLNLSNYSSNPITSISMNQPKNQYNSQSLNNGKNYQLKRTNRFQSKTNSNQTSTGNLKTLKRNTSQSIEKAMNVRVIKASSSLPKANFYKTKNVKNKNQQNNLNSIKKNIQKKLQINRAIGNSLLLKSFQNGQNKKKNINNFSTINYMANEPIPEELYLSQFQTINKNPNPNPKPSPMKKSTIKLEDRVKNSSSKQNNMKSPALNSSSITKLNVSKISNSKFESQKNITKSPYTKHSITSSTNSESLRRIRISNDYNSNKRITNYKEDSNSETRKSKENS